MTQKAKLGILLSGRGSNFAAIARNIASGTLAAEIALVLSNREDAPGLATARGLGLACRAIPSSGRRRAEHEAEVVAALREARVDLVILAGYMRLLSKDFIRAFPLKVLNIHPSLLPAFPGVDAQKQALDYGVKVTGCTVHFVGEGLDDGPIILQRTVAVRDDDTVDSLSARILEQEHIAYSEAIAKVIAGECQLSGRCVRFRKVIHP